MGDGEGAWLPHLWISWTDFHKAWTSSLHSHPMPGYWDVFSTLSPYAWILSSTPLALMINCAHDPQHFVFNPYFLPNALDPNTLLPTGLSTWMFRRPLQNLQVQNQICILLHMRTCSSIARPPPHLSTLPPGQPSPCPTVPVTHPRNSALKQLPKPTVFYHLHDYHPNPDYHAHSAGSLQPPCFHPRPPPLFPKRRSAWLQHLHVWRPLVLPAPPQAVRPCITQPAPRVRCDSESQPCCSVDSVWNAPHALPAPGLTHVPLSGYASLSSCGPPALWVTRDPENQK